MANQKKSNENKTIDTRALIADLFFKTFLTFLILLFLLLIISLTAYHLAYWEKTYPGVKIGSLHIGNLSLKEAQTVLQKQLDSSFKQGLTLNYPGKSKSFSLTELGAQYDLPQSVSFAYQIGRGKNPFLNFRDKWQALTSGLIVNAQSQLNEERLNSVLESIASETDQPPLNSTIQFQGGKMVVTPSKPGHLLDKEAAKNKIRAALAKLDNQPISLEVRPANPTINEQKAEKARVEAEKIIAKPLTLKYEGKTWLYEKGELANLLSFTPQKEKPLPALRVSLGEKAFEIKRVYALKNPSETDKASLQVNLNQEKVKETLTPVAKEINQEPLDAKFKFEGGKVTVFVPHQVGRELDETAALEKIAAAVESGQTEVELPVKVKSPSVTNEVANDFQIKELLGKGVSKFAGSVANRVYNIGLAAGRLNGTLVAPGETFSMYKAVGEVDGSTGYKEAYVISNGRTQLDYGGGVCQVSTTLFRAALEAGLPIVERHPHAYRVGYYEQDMPPGADASVYFPYSDLKFKNDTPGHLLIQTVADLKNFTLSFEIYGTSDGRKAEIGNFWLGNQVPAPAPLHQPDPNLPKGTTKQIDWAATGADASFTRTVTRNGETVVSDKFFSRYKPWQAVYLVGTKE
jgi:vancomycin resistance protein YoaR